MGSLGKSGDAEGQAEKGFLPEYSFLTKDEAGFGKGLFSDGGQGRQRVPKRVFHFR
ncbi:MAG: hypothetical protein ACLRSW_08680 [Christensenellaceae bacterium]